MKVAKPEVDGVQEKVKRARTQEEKNGSKPRNDGSL